MNKNTSFSEAWYGAVTAVNTMAGFRKSGVFPFNPNAVTTLPDQSADQHSPKGRKGSIFNDVDVTLHWFSLCPLVRVMMILAFPILQSVTLACSV